MKLKSWKHYAEMTKELKDKALAPLRSVREKKKAELAIAQLDEKIASQQAKIEEMCTTESIDFDKLIEAQDQLALNERKVRQLKEIVEQLFP